jgi:hypothetical protein
MTDLEKLLRSKTMNMFSDYFYTQITEDILKLKESKKIGYVYIIKNGIKGNMYKIGCAIDLDKRLHSYKTSFENGVFLCGFIKTNDYFSLEKEIHNFFNHKRKTGEWFNLSFEDLLNIKDSYEYITKNTFIDNKIKSEDLKQVIQEPNSNMYNFVKKLKKETEYYPYFLFKKYNEFYPNEINSVSWFGRELTKTINLSGFVKKDINKKGIRSFKII